jgi:hypothetical protein
MEEDFVAFENSDDNAGEGNSRNAGYAKYAGERSEHAEHEIADEFLPGDFLND